MTTGVSKASGRSAALSQTTVGRAGPVGSPAAVVGWSPSGSGAPAGTRIVQGRNAGVEGVSYSTSSEAGSAEPSKSVTAIGTSPAAGSSTEAATVGASLPATKTADVCSAPAFPWTSTGRTATTTRSACAPPRSAVESQMKTCGVPVGAAARPATPSPPAPGVAVARSRSVSASRRRRTVMSTGSPSGSIAV